MTARACSWVLVIVFAGLLAAGNTGLFMFGEVPFAHLIGGH